MLKDTVWIAGLTSDGPRNGGSAQFAERETRTYMAEFQTVKIAPYSSKSPAPRYMVVAVETDHREPIYRTLSDSEERTRQLAEQIAGCETCQRQYLRGEVGPNHTPSRLCHEGENKPHCRCAACYR